MKSTEFARRRRAIMRMVGNGGAVILPAAIEKARNRDTHYVYRQDSDFYYLTGFGEPEAVAVLVPGRSAGQYLLFCRDRDPQREIWDGYRAGPDGAVSAYGADDAFPIDDIDEILPGILESCERVYYTMGRTPEFDTRLIGWVNEIRSRGRTGVHPPDEFIALDHLLHDLRLFKSRSEATVMRKSARIAATAHERAMRRCAPGKFEYEIEAEFAHEFRRNGAVASYPPIVGSGANACVLHYIENDTRLEDGDLILIDAGCEYDYYASDITRTFPVNGRFTGPQREIYDVVRAAQQAAFDCIGPGAHWNEPHDAAVKVITRGLKKLGLLSGSPAKLIKDGAYKEFYMHRTGHWLGMDVHDVGDYKVGDTWRELEPGMAMTVEPGIYIAPDNSKVPARYRGIGVRIEDDVLVTRDGSELLTKNITSDPEEIEGMVGTAL